MVGWSRPWVISEFSDGWFLQGRLLRGLGALGRAEREGLARCARGCAPLPPRGNAPHGALRRSVERRVRIINSLSAIHKKARRWPGFFVYGGEGGIRTLDTRNAYGSLAGNWFQPLTHLSGTRIFRSLDNDLAAHDTSLREKYSPKIRHSRRCRCFFRVESAGRSLRGAPRLPSGR